MKNAFLHGDLEEVVYMDTPPRFQVSGAKGKVCRLKKAFYGFKKSPTEQFKRFLKVMITNGLDNA